MMITQIKEIELLPNLYLHVENCNIRCSLFVKEGDCVSLPGDCGFSHMASSRPLNEVAMTPC